jgi:hypothetical protein
MIEDYDSPWFQVHHNVVGVWFLFSLYLAVPVWLFTQLFPRLRSTPRQAFQHLAFFIAGWIAIFVAGNLDPTPFTEWLLD